MRQILITHVRLVVTRTACGAVAFLTALAALCLYPQAAHAQTPDVFEQGLLWRVEQPGAAPSYLFGTIHVADARVTTLPAAVRARLNAAQSFTMEIALDPPNIAALAARMVFTDGRNLPGVAGQELFQRLLPLVADYGVPAEVARRFRPWAAVLVLSIPPQESREVLDLVLNRMATAQGKRISYLETVDEQVAALEGMTGAEQIALLRHAVDTHDEMAAGTEAVLQAYLARDLARMWRASEESVHKRPALKSVNDVFVQRLLYDRSASMAERMRDNLARGNAFIAVGALHLYGPRGLPALLQKAGYRVSREY